MPVTPDSLFGLQQIGERIEKFAAPPEDLQLQNTVFAATEDCYSDTYRFDKSEFRLSLASFVGGRKSPSKSVVKPKKKVEMVALVHIREHDVLHSADILTQRAVGELSDNAVAEVNRVEKQLEMRIDLAVERFCAMAMAGSYALNDTNFPGSEIDVTFTRSVTALTPLSASWATASTKIVSKDVQDWRRQMKRASGIPVDRLMFAREVSEYLLANTEVQAWIQHTQKGVNTFETAMLERAGGIPTWQEYEGFYIPEGGSATGFIGATEVFALPRADVLSQICKRVQGFGEIPTGAIGAPPGAMGGATRAPTSGKFGYVMPIQDGDPPGFKVFRGWYGFVICKMPEAIGYRSSILS